MIFTVIYSCLYLNWYYVNTICLGYYNQYVGKLIKIFIIMQCVVILLLSKKKKIFYEFDQTSY